MKRVIKNNIRYILPLLMVSVFLFFVLYSRIEGEKRIKDFYNSGLKNTIVKRNNWQMRVVTFVLDNKIKIDLSGSEMKSFDLSIGDSIVKKPKSYVFEVYRKGKNGTYYFFRKYKLRL